MFQSNVKLADLLKANAFILMLKSSFEYYTYVIRVLYLCTYSLHVLNILAAGNPLWIACKYTTSKSKALPQTQTHSRDGIGGDELKGSRVEGCEAIRELLAKYDEVKDNILNLKFAGRGHPCA